jgi:WD40 repeat protein
MQPSRAGTLLRVLICCVAEDEVAARELARRLRVERCEAQLSLDGPVGASLARSEVAILCLSPRSTEHGQLAHSLSTALDLARRSAGGRRLVLGVKLADCSVPPALADLPLVDWYAPRGYERLMRTLWGHIATLRNHPRAVPTPAPQPDQQGRTTAPATAPTVSQSIVQAVVTAPTLRFRAKHPEFERRQVQRLSRGLPGQIWAMNNTQVVAATSGGALQIDMASGEPVWEIDAPLRCAALSPDKQTMALSSGVHVLLWDLEQGTLRATYATTQRVTSLAFHPQGNMLLAGGIKGAMTIWRLEGRSSAPVQPMTVHATHHDLISVIACSPDGNLIATGSVDRSTKLWRMLDRSLLRTFSEVGAVEALAFSPDGATLAVGHRNRAVSLWDVASGQQQRILADHDGAIEALAFAPNGTFLASGCTDGSISLWQTHDGTLLRDLQGVGGRVTGLAITPDNKTLFASSEDGLCSLDLRSGTTIKALQPFGYPISALALGKGSVMLGQREGRAQIRNLATGEIINTIHGREGTVVGVGFLTDGQASVAVTSRGGITKNTEGRGSHGTGSAESTEVGTQHAASPLEGTETTQAGMNLRHATVCGNDLILSAGEGGILIWRAEATGWQQWATLPTRPRRVRFAAMAQTGNMLAAVFEEGGVQTWHVPKNRQGTPDLFRAWQEAGRAFDLAFTPDAGALVVACEDGVVRIWRLADGSQHGSFSSEGVQAGSIGLTPDGKVLAVGFRDGSIRLWRLNLQPGKQKQGRPSPITLFGHASAVERLSFSPDGTALVTVGSDGTVRVWPL